MMIGPDFIFISTMKCATYTMFEVLSQYGGERKGGPHERPYNLVNSKNKFSFSICRNPYSRAVSIWWYACLPHLENIPVNTRNLDFRKLVRDYTNFEPFALWLNSSQRTGGLTNTQEEWLKGMNIDKYLHIENLQTEFLSLPFVNVAPKKWPILNQTRNVRKHYSEYLTPKAIKAIQEWAKEDFIKFGYSK